MLDPSVALLAPGGKHLRVATDGRINLTDEPEIGALRPRADLMISDAAKVFGERTLLVVMTGMGNDGLRGAEEVNRRGGRILVEAAVDLHGLRDAACRRGGQAWPTRSCRCMNWPSAIAPQEAGGMTLDVTPSMTTSSSASFLRKLTGIDLSQYKRPQMERRLRTFYANKGVNSLTDALERLRSDPQQLEELLDRITINVSQLWRNPEQWEVIQNAPAARAGRAGPASGRGAPAAPTAPRHTRWRRSATWRSPGKRVSISGTDIDKRMVDAGAARAVQRGRRADAPPRSC